MREYCLEHVPDASFYVKGLIALSDHVTKLRRTIITAHYYAPARRVTAPQLAALASVDGGYPIVNAQYGGLGHAFCETTGFKPQIRSNGTARWWGVWSKGFDHPDGFIWQMHDPVARALETTGWVNSNDPQLLPEELHSHTRFTEGACIQVTVNCYERNRGARLVCLEHYGYDCIVCGFNFRLIYGDRGRDYIHVHHLVPLAEIRTDYVVDPIADLRPICPNCHAMIHRSSPPLTIEELQRMVTPLALQSAQNKTFNPSSGSGVF